LKNLGLEFRVGLFTIVGIVTSGFLIWFVEPERFDSSENNSYYTILKDASGIVAKTHVKTNGVTVGKVTSVKLLNDESSTRIEFEVDETVKLPVGSKLDIRTVGLLGDKFIEIVRTESAPDGYIPKGGFVPRTTSGVDMNELLSIAGSIAKDIKKITGTLAETLGHHEGQDKLANILDNIEAITENMNNILVDNRSDVRSVVTNLRESTAMLRDVFNSENGERLARIIESFDQSMDDVKGVTQNIKLVSEKVKNGEGTIGKLLSDEATIAEIQGAIKDIREVISPATKLKIGIDYHGEARGDKTFQNHFNIQLKTRPDRFYLLGVTDGGYEITDTTTRTKAPEDPGPGETNSGREIKYVRETARLRANLQIAQRWYFAQVRFGLFESAGGFGADFFALRDRLKLSFEAFDWKLTANDVRRVSHLKAYASILFFNHIYVMIGVDDPTRFDIETGKERGAQNYFAGAGFNFDDNDLKAVFGSAALMR
jgi:phospholipid/cholesterol/gamma-HCH transport system substrate-binding protein